MKRLFLLGIVVLLAAAGCGGGGGHYCCWMYTTDNHTQYSNYCLDASSSSDAETKCNDENSYSWLYCSSCHET
jgi:hypothetical protein